MTYQLTMYELLTLIGSAGFLGLLIGFGLGCIMQSGHSKNAFWEEE